jgi:protein-disulfide isomerase
MIVFSDFSCAACRQFARDVLPGLVERYVSTGKLRIGFKHFDLGRLKAARTAAVMSACAGSQGKFLQAYESLFALPPPIDDAGIRRAMESLSLNRASFDACLVAEGPAIVDGDQEYARLAGLRSTPTFMFGTADAVSMQPRATIGGTAKAEKFYGAIEALLR